MKRVIFFGLILLLAACASDTNKPSSDTVSPAIPSNVKVLAGNAQAIVSWQANSESDLESYTIYWGSAVNNLADSVIVDKTASSKTVTGLTNDTTYFFALSAEDTSGNKSTLSEPIAITPSATADITPPILQSSNPADNATDVPPRNPSITLVFSEPMNAADFAFSIVPPFRASDASLDELLELTWNNNDTTLTIKPSVSELVPENTLFTLTLTTANDRAGNALVGDNDITFTTGKDIPRLVSSVPADGATDVPLGTSTITLTFSKPLEAKGFHLDKAFYCDSGSVENNDTEFILLGCELADNHTYEITFDGQDQEGNAFTGKLSFTTIPDTTPPSVTGSVPGSDQTTVALQDNIIIYFDDEMDEASTLGAVSSNLPLGCTWELSQDLDTLVCEPSNLQADTTYVITIGEEAKDTSEKNLVGSGFCRGSPPCSYTFKFSTGSTIDETRPTINTDLSEPDNGAEGIPIHSTINVIFTEKMNEASVERVFRADTGDTEITGTFGWFNSGMVFFPSSPLPSCTNIHVTITTEATDRALNFLANPYDITFKTVCN